MDSFETQLKKQLDKAYYDELKTLSFLGCSVSSSDVKHLKENLDNDLMGSLEDLEFAFCTFEELHTDANADSNTNDGSEETNASPSLSLLKDWLSKFSKRHSLRRLTWIDNGNCTMNELAAIVQESRAPSVNIRFPRNVNVVQHAKSICTLLESCTMVKDFCLFVCPPRTINRRWNQNPNDAMIVEDNDADDVDFVESKSPVLRICESMQRLRKIQRLKLKGMMMEDMDEWSTFVEEGLCRLPVLETLSLENVAVRTKSKHNRGPNSSAATLERLMRHVTNKIVLSRVASCLLSIIPVPLLASPNGDNGTKLGRAVREFEIHRSTLQGQTLHKLWKAPGLQHPHCALKSLTLRHIQVIHGSKSATREALKQPPTLRWKGLLKAMPQWTCLAQFHISEIRTNAPTSVNNLARRSHHRDQCSSISSLLWQRQLQTVLQQNTSLTKAHVEVSGSGDYEGTTKAVILSPALAERNRQVQCAQQWILRQHQKQHRCDVGACFDPNGCDDSVTLLDSAKCSDTVKVTSSAQQHVTMLTSLNHPAAIHTIVHACAPTDWAHTKSRKRKQ